MHVNDIAAVLFAFCVFLVAPSRIAQASQDIGPLYSSETFSTPSETLSIQQKLDGLLAKSDSERDRALAIYRWVTTHFRHDAGSARRIGDPAKRSLESLFRAGAGSCAVFANVTHRLLEQAGLNVRTVYGLAKGGAATTYVNGKPANHVWNAIEIGGTWYLIDTTWGAGYVGRHGFQRQQNDLFFLVQPQRAVLSHFDPSDQFGYQAALGIDRHRFNRIDEDATYAAAIGFDTASILNAQAMGSRTNKLVRTFDTPANAFRVLEAPVLASLKQRTLRFRIESSSYEEVMVLQGKSWTPMRKQGVVHSIDIKPTRGELMIMARRVKEHDFEALLAYTVQ